MRNWTNHERTFAAHVVNGERNDVGLTLGGNACCQCCRQRQLSVATPATSVVNVAICGHASAVIGGWRTLHDISLGKTPSIRLVLDNGRYMTYCSARHPLSDSCSTSDEDPFNLMQLMLCHGENPDIADSPESENGGGAESTKRNVATESDEELSALQAAAASASDELDDSAIIPNLTLTNDEIAASNDTEISNVENGGPSSSSSSANDSGFGATMATTTTTAQTGTATTTLDDNDEQMMDTGDNFCGNFGQHFFFLDILANLNPSEELRLLRANCNNNNRKLKGGVSNKQQQTSLTVSPDQFSLKHQEHSAAYPNLMEEMNLKQQPHRKEANDKIDWLNRTRRSNAFLLMHSDQKALLDRLDGLGRRMLND
ncbi:hypothetical protein GPALN_015054 [Globodera pallida]|nr:hypothetical protein GPALN_015054 [Globodera pallida]